VCGIDLAPKTEAVWDGEVKQATCLVCSGDSDAAQASAGVAGGSALAKAEELSSGRVAEARDRWGDHAAVVAARMAESDPSIGSWVKGGAGESRLAAWIEREVGDAVIALHDRVIPGLRGTNIDHLFVAESGVWIVDAKAYKGKVEHRDLGPLWRVDPRLFVAGRDRTKLIDGLARQLTAVRAALEPDPAYEQIPIHP